MSTNYYVVDFRANEKTHIGKSSFGWCFALRQYAHIGLMDLHDWIKFFESKNFSLWCSIFNEYGDPVDIQTFLTIVTERKGISSPISEDKLKSQGAERGPKNLLRCKLKSSSFEHGCIKHGEGTWDIFDTEFS